MDPISALSLAANVIQVVDFGVDCVRGCVALYEKGSRDEDGFIDKYAVDVAESNKALQDALKQQRLPSTGPAGRLASVATDASKVTGDLRIELGKLKLSKSQGIRRAGEAFKVTLRGLIKSGKISKLQHRLEGLEKTLKSTLVKEIYMQIGRDNVTRKVEFEKLSQSQQNLIAQILTAQRAIIQEVTVGLEAAENRLAARLDSQNNTAAQYHNNQNALIQAQQQEACRQRVLKALAFPEMKERRNMIETRVNDFGDTCHWIFSRADNQSSTLNTLNSDITHVQDLTHDSGSDGRPDGDINNGTNTIDFRDTYSVRIASNDEALGETDLGSDTVGEVSANTLGLDDEPETESDAASDSSVAYPRTVTNTAVEHYLAVVADEDRFAPWLDTPSLGLYWISGKPGSGKSSLMNYIFHNLQGEIEKSRSSRDWAGPEGVRLLSFWLYRPSSTTLLKSLQGFWRSLCHQILAIDTALMLRIHDTNGDAAPPTLRSSLTPGGTVEEAWTDRELEEWFVFCLRHSEHKFFLLVDGLDEMEGDREHLVSILLLLSREANLRVCCASRPETPFNLMFNSKPTLHLHHVNSNDILQSCNSILAGTTVEHFASRIERRARGVFLWAHLVAKDLARASRQLADEDEIELILTDFAEEMGALFLQLLHGMDKFHRRRPKPYLSLLKYAQENYFYLTSLTLHLASLEPADQPDWLRLALSCDPTYLTSLKVSLFGFWPKVDAACGGLVETYDSRSRRLLRSPPWQAPSPDLVKANTMGLRFIHTSVSDFLRENEEAQAYLGLVKLSDDELRLRLAYAFGATALLDDETHEDRIADTLRAVETIQNVDLQRKGIYMLEALFARLARHVEPSGMRVDFYLHHKLCPDLSLAENMRLSWLVRCGCERLLEHRMDAVAEDSPVLMSFAAYCWNGHLHMQAKRILPWARGILKRAAEGNWRETVFFYMMPYDAQDSWPFGILCKATAAHHFIVELVLSQLHGDEHHELLLSLLDIGWAPIGGSYAEIWLLKEPDEQWVGMPGFDSTRSPIPQCLLGDFIISLRVDVRNNPSSLRVVGWKLVGQQKFSMFADFVERGHTELRSAIRVDHKDSKAYGEEPDLDIPRLARLADITAYTCETSPHDDTSDRTTDRGHMLTASWIGKNDDPNEPLFVDEFTSPRRSN